VCLNGLDVKGDNIPPTDHVSHLCYGKGIEDGQISAAAFMPRPTEAYLSVNWLEWLQCQDRSSEITEVRKRYTRFNLKKKYRIALLNVGVTCSKVATESEDNRCLKATHEPKPDDDSHSGLWGYTYNDTMIAELIRLSVLDDFPAIDTP
jgi:hypothetical protein